MTVTRARFVTFGTVIVVVTVLVLARKVLVRIAFLVTFLQGFLKKITLHLTVAVVGVSRIWGLGKVNTSPSSIVVVSVSDSVTGSSVPMPAPKTGVAVI